MNRIFSRLLRDTRGIAAIEMSFIMPVLLILYFGLVDLTSMISMNRKVTYAASVVADLVTQNETTVTAADITDYLNAAEMVMKPTPVSGVRIEVYQYHKTGSAISSQWNETSVTGTSCGGAPSTSGMTDLMTDGNDVIVARVCMTYTPYIATFLGKHVLGATSFTLSEQIALRPRQSATLACTGC
jgi:Flp pilus assembly protein TadG